MASLEQHASSGLSDSDSSVGSSGQPQPARSRTTAAPHTSEPTSGSGPSSHFYTHPSRTSILGTNGGGQLPNSISAFPSTAAAPRNNTTSNMADTGDGRSDMTAIWRASGSLPSFSRGFELFMGPVEQDGPDSDVEDSFFVPSYLSESAYMRKLEDSHRCKIQAQKELKRSAANGTGPNVPGFAQQLLPSGTHRGLSHNVVERPLAFEDDESMTPLPSKWNKDDMWGGIEILPDGLSVKYTGPKSPHERDHEASAVRADHFMPRQCGLYYYEVHIINGKRDDTTIAIGFATKAASTSRPVGWEPESWAYHGDDGRCFTGQNIGRPFGATFNTGDVIGCGVNFRDHTAFFTRNGVMIGVAFYDVGRGKLFPAISLKKPGEHVTVNFGQTPFVFDIDNVMKEQKTRVQRDMENMDLSKFEPGMSESELLQALVLQFLQHDGYVETARAFAEDVKQQKEALNLDPNVTVDGINIKDDEDANNRQRIRRAVLEGDIDRALKHTNAYYPQVFKDNEEVYFKLRCRKFIEMVRQAAQLRSNGNQSSVSQVMELDSNGGEASWAGNKGMDSETEEPHPELIKLEQEMLQYGQTLGADYANDQRKEITKALGEVWALVAYANPLKEPQVRHLLDRKGRIAVAEELNSAILSSLGKSSRASLETLYVQTSALLDELRTEGGSGAFISVQDVMDTIKDVPR